MSLHLVWTDAAGESRLAPLRIADTQMPGDPAVSACGWRSLVWAGPDTLDPWHVAKEHGSIQMILGGALKITVSDGVLRSVVGRAGDAFLFVDVQGRGHQAERVGDEPLHAINIRLSDDWNGLVSAFSDWPEGARLSAQPRKTAQATP